MIFDPLYFIILAPALLLGFWAQMKVKSAFTKSSQIPVRSGLTGAQAAAQILRRHGLSHVGIEPARGFLSDHYNPTNKTLALSEQVYSSNSVAAIGVATHEAGHAIQHATNYAPLWLRSALVPTVGIGSKLGLIMMAVGLFFQGGDGKFGDGLVIIGAILFSAVLLFQLVTLPVEFNASSRAKRLVVEAGIVFPEERRGIDAVLNAAALTYVAAVLQTLLTLLYYLWRAGLLGGRRD